MVPMELFVERDFKKRNEKGTFTNGICSLTEENYNDSIIYHYWNRQFSNILYKVQLIKLEKHHENILNIK